MRRIIFSAMALAAGFAGAAPEATVTALVQRSGSCFEVSYRLTAAPAVVWMDVQTNGPAGFASIGAEAIYGDGFAKGSPEGDVGCVATAGEGKVIRWNPHRTWKDRFVPAGNLRVVLRAYAAENAPAYMGVNLETGAVRYFPSAETVPGGVKATSWRTTRMLFRRIPAHGVTWLSGNPFTNAAVDDERAWCKSFRFTNDFYAAVFETSQRQWKTICGSAVVPYVAGDLLPMERASFRHVRETDGTSASAGDENEAYMYPNPPCPTSFLGRLRELTKSAAFPSGIDFDLPGEAQWKYACQAGCDAEHWGTGAWAETGGETSAVPGRCSNSADVAGGTAAPAEGGTYAPNSFGLYDMHGNVFELCLDWYLTNPTLTGDWLVNANGKTTVSDPDATVSARVRLGGWYGVKDTYARGCFRTSSADEKIRTAQTPATMDARCGFRVFCRAGLK